MILILSISVSMSLPLYPRSFPSLLFYVPRNDPRSLRIPLLSHYSTVSQWCHPRHWRRRRWIFKTWKSKFSSFGKVDENVSMTLKRAGNETASEVVSNGLHRNPRKTGQIASIGISDYPILVKGFNLFSKMLIRLARHDGFNENEVIFKSLFELKANCKIANNKTSVYM